MSTVPQVSILPGKCDVCNKVDGYQGHNLQKCQDCGLLVHEMCYATIPTTSKNPQFVCHACKAVGKDIEVNVPSKLGGCAANEASHRELMRQETRPVECVLCNVKSGIHAMHPLYDMEGPEGRQLVLPASGVGFMKTEKRLAWVHSLCAQFICTYPRTKGYVYGCYENGKFDTEDVSSDASVGENEQLNGRTSIPKYEVGSDVRKEFDQGSFYGKVIEYHSEENLYTIKYEDDDEEDLTEEELEEVLITNGKPSPNKKICVSSESFEDENDLASTLWFCIAAGKAGKRDQKYHDHMKEFRKLKCVLCKANDKHSLRVPVQCCAWDEHEFKEFRKCHKKTDEFDKVCIIAMHVGCARWQTEYSKFKGKKLRMCYYYPGQKPTLNADQVRFSEPVSNCFCRNHAREVMENIRKIDAESSDDCNDENDPGVMKKAITKKRRRNKFLEDSEEE